MCGTAVHMQQGCAQVGKNTDHTMVTLGSCLSSFMGQPALAAPASAGWLQLPASIVVTSLDVKESQPVWAEE